MILSKVYEDAEHRLERNEITLGEFEGLVDIEVERVVKCGECKHRETCCRPCYKSADSYCSDGERREQ